MEKEMTVANTSIQNFFRNHTLFLVGVVGSIVSWGITNYYLEVGNPYITGLAFLASVIILREEFWGAFGAILAGIALDLYLSEGRLTEALVIGGLILFFTILQLVALAWSKIGTDNWSSKSHVAIHTLFALIGLIFGYYLNTRYCELGHFADWAEQSSVARWAIFSFCPFFEILGGNSQIQSGSGFDNVAIDVISGTLRNIFLLPITWGGIFAAISGLRFNIRRPRQVIGHTARVLFGSGLYAIPFLIGLFLLYFFDILPEWRELLSSLFIGIVIFLVAFRMGQKAEKVPNSYIL